MPPAAGGRDAAVGAARTLAGLAVGTAFGFLLHRGGLASYDTIVSQLLLRDFTVLRVMLSACATGMVGIHVLFSLGLASPVIKGGSWVSVGVGGTVFGAGFALLGYCPGTAAAAAGSGALDALLGGVPGILLGAWTFAVLYPRLAGGILRRGWFGDLTLPRLLGTGRWAVAAPLSILLVLVLVLLEKAP